MKKNLKINRGEENTKKKIGNSYLQNIGSFRLQLTIGGFYEVIGHVFEACNTLHIKHM